jgi:hypothetical protein
LQLLAMKLQFNDPVTQLPRRFSYESHLSLS